MRKIIVHHRSYHHAQNSGYGKLADYIENAELLRYNDSGFPYSIAKKLAKLSSQEAGFYDTVSFIKDYEFIKLLCTAKKDNGIIHYLNGERDIRYGVALNNYLSKFRVAATFHKPPDILARTIKDTSYLKKINGAVAVGENQVDFLKNWLDLEKVRFIPHGIDTAFFKPDESRKKENTLLFVGQHLRDFEALNYAVPRLKEKIPSLKINAVLRNDFANKILPNDAISVFSGLDDEDLRKMYQEAALLFLPLENVTACNSILEGMACGLPVISTDIAGNRGYVENNSGVLVPPNDYKALVDETVALLRNQDKRTEMGRNSREASLGFEWGKVSEMVMAFYNEI
jgi:glycosyltransferase involved in cell wall biosynthesis